MGAEGAGYVTTTMASTTTPGGHMPSDFVLLFGAETAPLASAVLAVIDSDPGANWTAPSLAVETGISLVTLMIIVARLIVAGDVHHDGLGDGYRSIQPQSQRRAG
jgi:hypothetical protein